jgi:hypothetical protein
VAAAFFWHEIDVIDLSTITPLFSTRALQGKEGLGEIFQIAGKIPLYPPDMADNCQGEKTSPTAFTYKSAFYSYMQGINRDVIIVATVDHSDIRVF